MPVTDPSDLSPREAWHQYLGTRSPETTAGSQKTYHYRLKLWAEWCEERELEHVGELSGWILEQYRNDRAADGLAATTLRGEMQTLKNFIEFLERIEAVEDGLADRVKVPKVPEGEESSDTKLHTDDAMALITYYRGTDAVYGTKHHAFLELAWHTGARLGALRGLDLRDYKSDEQYVSFVHRPETETPLKNKKNGERLVALRPGVCEVLDEFIRKYRHSQHDDYGRAPLLPSLRGRASKNTIRTWSYLATHPCRHGSCPHGYNPSTCQFRAYHHASKCPSSRSPHQIRTGSITWHRDSGYPSEVTSERVNASERVIDRHYDKASRREVLEHRRRPHLDKLAIEEDS